MNTPYYQYDLKLLRETLDVIHSEINSVKFKVHYAIKANSNSTILEIIKDEGMGADCVSLQEMKWALQTGFESSDIVFAGVGKSDEEILFAIKNKIGVIHCEGFQEVEIVNEMAVMLNEKINIALRLNPDINAKTHEKITTGLKNNKFGFSEFELTKLIEQKENFKNINVVGLHFHIGSQISDMTVFEAMCDKINEYIVFFKEHFHPFTYLNVGGGLGIDYENPDINIIPNFKEYFDVFKSRLTVGDFDVHFELGRSIVGQCGVLNTKVLYIKESETKHFAVVDAGMTELLRPALYNAYHQIDYDGISFKSNTTPYDVVGPICESSDCLGSDVMLPELKRGDILTVKSCGAYAESMSLNYNGREKVQSIFIN